MWLALSLNKEATVSVWGKEVKMPFKDIADGCCGCLLVFNSKRDAAGYAGVGGSIVEVDFAEQAGGAE